MRPVPPRPSLTKDSLEHELVQTAAVAVCWLEALGFTRSGALVEVSAERSRQDTKWGSQRHLQAEVWLAILGEEYGEVCTAVNEARCDKEARPGPSQARIARSRRIAARVGRGRDGRQDRGAPPQTVAARAPQDGAFYRWYWRRVNTTRGHPRGGQQGRAS